MRRFCAILLVTALASIAPLAVAPTASAGRPGAGAHVKSIRIRHRPSRARGHRHRHHRRHHHRHRHPATSGNGSRKPHSAARAALECPDANVLPTSSNLDSVRAATFCLVNRERVLHGERPLRLNQKLQRAAQRHSEAMVSQDYFSHYEPSGEGPAGRMRAAGYIYGSNIGYEVGENIAWGTRQLSTPSAIVTAWMRSPGHRANILDPRFRETAVGVVAALPPSYGNGQPGAIYTQDFGVLIPG